MRTSTAVLLTTALAALAPEAIAQTPAAGDSAPPPKPSLFKDPEDGAFDVGGWVATRRGILPVPAVITEPAVGYGGAVALILIHGGGLGGVRDAPPGVTGKPVPPDISALAGAATENGTWAAFAAHMGYWGGDRWRYTGVAGYVSPRLDTYDAQGRAYGFNLAGWLVYQEMKLRLGRSNLFVGGRFLYSNSTVRFTSGLAPKDVPAPEFATVDSGLGPIVELDSRDSTFTPSSGVQIKASALFYGPYLGGDHAYERYTGDARFYWDVSPRLVLAARVAAQSVAGDAPFYSPRADLTSKVMGTTGVGQPGVGAVDFMPGVGQAFGVNEAVRDKSPQSLAMALIPGSNDGKAIMGGADAAAKAAEASAMQPVCGPRRSCPRRSGW